MWNAELGEAQHRIAKFRIPHSEFIIKRT